MDSKSYWSLLNHKQKPQPMPSPKGYQEGFAVVVQLLTNRKFQPRTSLAFHSSQHSKFYLWIRIEHMLVPHSLGPSQNCLPPWCFNIMPSTFIEGLYKKKPHEAHFCICCEIGIRTMSIKLLNVPYLRPT